VGREKWVGKRWEGKYISTSAVAGIVANRAPLTAFDRESGMGKVGREKVGREMPQYLSSGGVSCETGATDCF